jgi:hypothetical protein
MYGSSRPMKKPIKPARKAPPRKPKKEVVDLGGDKPVKFEKGGLKKSLGVSDDYTFSTRELERIKGHEIGKKFQFKGKKFEMDDKLKKQVVLALNLMKSKK